MDAQSEKLLAHLLRNARIAALGTIRDGAPRLSMVAFVTVENLSSFYIHVSRLAQNSMDMLKDKHISLLVAETDDARVDPQTLVNVSIRGYAEEMQIGEPGYTPVRNSYIQRFPDSEPLFKPNEFCLWRITPKGGRFVAGMTKSYNITPETLHKVSQR